MKNKKTTNPANEMFNETFEELADNLHFCSDVEQLIWDFKDQKEYTNMTDYLLARLVVAAENISYYVEDRAIIESLKDHGIDPSTYRRDV